MVKQILRGRSCRNCTGPIPRPTGNNIKKKIFCCDNCRKEFHKNNGISVHKLKEQVERWVSQQNQALQEAFQLMRLAIEHLERRIEALESRRRRRGDSPAEREHAA